MVRTALRAIDSLDAALAADGRRAATRRQRRWALTDLARHAAAVCGVSLQRLTVADMLAPESVASWLAAAGRGQTRARGGGQSSAAAQRARLASVRALASHLRAPVPALPRLPRVERLPSPDEADAVFAIRILGRSRPVGLREKHWIRTTALAALVLDTGARIGELSAVRLTDLSLAAPTGGGEVTLPDRPPGHRLPIGVELYDPAYMRTMRFGAPTADAVRRWLTVRRRLVAGLEGGDPQALWVAVGAGGDADGPAGQRPGMPLSSRSLHRSWRRTAGLLDRLEVAGVPARLGALATRAD